MGQHENDEVGTIDQVPKTTWKWLNLLPWYFGTESTELDNSAVPGSSPGGRTHFREKGKITEASSPIPPIQAVGRFHENLSGTPCRLFLINPIPSSAEFAGCPCGTV